ncbi:MFS transporter [Kitasatospora camelliae]|uniref:MFS transporter n=1 Tax=Kitasatospora camelliae TaxID=3156397 RepID=A0AAU8JVD4_9ACTN
MSTADLDERNAHAREPGGGSAATVPAPAPALTPLRRNWRFQLLWGGAASAMLGTLVADTAYPLLLLALTGSPSLAGSFAAVQFTAMVLLGLHGGVLADRHDRRRILILADATRLAAALSVVLALTVAHLTVAHALLVAAVLGATMAYGGPVRMLAVRSVVPPEQLRQALAQDEIRVSGAALIGPPLAGFLLGLGRAVPFLTTALTSLLALGAAVAVRFDGKPGAADAADPAADRDPAPDDRDPASDATTATTATATTTAGNSGGMLDGLRHLTANPLLRSTVLLAFALNLAGAAVTLCVIVLMRDGGTSSSGIGFALAGEAVGGLLGAPLVRRLHRMLAPGALQLTVAWTSVPLFLVPAVFDGGPVTVFAVLLLMMLGVPALRVMVDVLIFQRVPDALRGRVIAATMTAFMLGMPVGMFTAGLLLDHHAPGTVLTVFAAVLAAGLLPLTLGRSLRGTSWPAPVD